MYEQNNEQNNERQNPYTNETYQWQPSEPVTPPVQRKAKKQHKFAKKLGTAAAIGLAFGLVAGGTFQGINMVADVVQSVYAGKSDEEVPKENVEVPKVAETKPGIPASAVANVDGNYTVSEIAQLCMPSVVAITNKGVTEIQSWFGPMQQESQSAGSGIIVGQNDTELLIATNNHVVAGANELSVCFNDNTEQVFQALTKGTNAAYDLAIISIELKDIPADVLSTIRVAELGDSGELQVGEQVVAIGNALGYGQSVTSGYVSALNRTVNIDNMTAELIQTDAAINPGNSGGALINMKGQVIGINSAKFASSTIEGMGYAIPISTALPILNDLEDRVTRTKVDESEEGYLGISCQNVSSEAQFYGIPAGVYIAEVNEGSAAEKSGMKKGDILTKFDGLTVGSVTELKSTLQYYRSGETVDIVVARMSADGYSEETLSITLDAKK